MIEFHLVQVLQVVHHHLVQAHHQVRVHHQVQARQVVQVHHQVVVQLKPDVQME